MINYSYQAPEYSQLVKPVAAPLNELLPGEKEDKDLPTYEQLTDEFDKLTKKEQADIVKSLIYAHLSNWQKGEDGWPYGMIASLALVQHGQLHELLPVLLEVLRQDESFFQMLQDSNFDGLTVLTGVLNQTVQPDDLPLLHDFMMEPGLLSDGKKIVAFVVGNLPKREPETLAAVQQRVVDVLQAYEQADADSNLFDGMLIEALAYVTIHTHALDAKSGLIRLYGKHNVTREVVAGGINDVRKLIKKADIGTLDMMEEDGENFFRMKEMMAIHGDDEWDDENEDNEEEDGDEWKDDTDDFDMSEYDEQQEYRPWAENRQAVYMPVKTMKKLTLTITLKGSKPAIWRKLEVPSSLRLDSLAGIILVALGWDEDHLHQFITKDRKFYATSTNELENDFGMNPRTRDGRKYTIGQLLKKKNDVVVFEYDYGDSWGHDVVLTSIEDYTDGEKPAVHLLDGKRSCPPEDCGGIPGYYHLCEAMKHPDSREAHSLIEWLGCRFDPEYFPLKTAQRIIEKCN